MLSYLRVSVSWYEWFNECTKSFYFGFNVMAMLGYLRVFVHDNNDLMTIQKALVSFRM